MMIISLRFEYIIPELSQSAASCFSVTGPFLFLYTPHRLLFAAKILESDKAYSKLMRGQEFP